MKERLVGICPSCESLFTTEIEIDEIDIEIIDREKAIISNTKIKPGKLIVVQCSKCHRLVNLIPEERREKANER
jgi:hypothetical protein